MKGNVMGNSCRLCGALNISECFEIGRSPKNIQRLLKSEELVQDSPICLTIYQCHECGFVQIPPQLEEDYYDDYLMTASHSIQMQEYQSIQARDFIKRYSLSGKKIWEVGCGDGSYLGHLKNNGAIVYGIEPSTKFREVAIKNGFDVAGGYVDKGCIINGGLFDAFVSREVLEHIPDIHGFLQGIRVNIKVGGVGLIQVPSLEKAIKDHRFYDFFPDHVNYFTLSTLRLALEINGFEVIDSFHGMNGEYNIVLVRNSLDLSLKEMQNTVATLGLEVAHFIAENKKNGKKVAIWGAGGKGVSLMASTNVDGEALLIDADPYKQGFYTPVSHLKVESPEILHIENIGAILITAMAYRDEIIKLLLGKYKFTGTIACLGHHLEIIQP